LKLLSFPQYNSVEEGLNSINLKTKENNNNSKINIIDQTPIINNKNNNNLIAMSLSNQRKNSSQVENKTAEFSNFNNPKDKKDLNNTSIISEVEQNKTVSTVRTKN
jgi:hypothetical protein